MLSFPFLQSPWSILKQFKVCEALVLIFLVAECYSVPLLSLILPCELAEHILPAPNFLLLSR